MQVKPAIIQGSSPMPSFPPRHLYIRFPPEPILHSSTPHQVIPHLLSLSLSFSNHPRDLPTTATPRMELLDMVPADAIVLRLYSLPAAVAAAASLYYAWLVAALAAAVGLWRIRAVSAGVRRGSAIVDNAKSKVQSPSPPPAIEEPRLAAPAAEPAEAASPSGEPSTPSKVRFTAYYGGSGDANDDGVVDGVRRCADEDDDDEAVLRRTASALAERRREKALLAAAAAPWGEREMSVRRRGDLGWYRHLDMAALDGSVVKLWDGEVMTASPRVRRRRAGLELQLSF